MHVILYKRHKQSCPHKADKTYRRCRCSVWLEYNVNGIQTRKSAKTLIGKRHKTRRTRLQRPTWTPSLDAVPLRQRLRVLSRLSRSLWTASAART